jgi:hypothetical protein
MRVVRAAGTEVLAIGRARRTSYAARQRLRGLSDPLPVFQIDERVDTAQAITRLWHFGQLIGNRHARWQSVIQATDFGGDDLPGKTRQSQPINSGPGLRMMLASVRSSGRSALIVCTRFARLLGF